MRDVRTALDHDAGGQRDVLVNHAMRPHVRGRVDRRRGMDDRCGMHAGGELFFRVENLEQAREGESRVLHPDDGLGLRAELPGDEDGGGEALLRLLEEGLVFSKSQKTRAGDVRRGEAGKRQCFVAFDLPADARGDVGDREMEFRFLAH